MPIKLDGVEPNAPVLVRLCYDPRGAHGQMVRRALYSDVCEYHSEKQGCTICHRIFHHRSSLSMTKVVEYNMLLRGFHLKGQSCRLHDRLQAISSVHFGA